MDWIQPGTRYPWPLTMTDLFSSLKKKVLLVQLAHSLSRVPRSPAFLFRKAYRSDIRTHKGRKRQNGFLLMEALLALLILSLSVFLLSTSIQAYTHALSKGVSESLESTSS